YFICLDRDSAKAVYVALNIILEVPIGDGTQKWHSSIHCPNARLSRTKPIDKPSHGPMRRGAKLRPKKKNSSTRSTGGKLPWVGCDARNVCTNVCTGRLAAAVIQLTI